MTRVPVHTIDSAPEPSTEVLSALAAKMGKVLNIHGKMAHSPVVLHSYAALQEVIREHGTLDGRTREAIALTVGAVNECSYCQSAHTVAGRAAGLSEEDTVQIRRGRFTRDPKTAALLEVARQMTADTGYVADDTWRAALDAGWSDAQVAEVSTHVTLNLLTNYFNHLVGTELDVPAAPGLELERTGA